MNTLDTQYTTLLQDILDNGVEKSDRTGTGTISVFGRQIRHKMSEGFPLLTTKKMFFKGIVTELLWFLRGDTDIRFLWKNNCTIWDGDWYKKYKTTCSEPYTLEEVKQKVKDNDHYFHDSMFDMGPIYGKQWRSWETIGFDVQNASEDGKFWSGECWNTEPIDQIANLINDLKTNPDSRRLMVNAWNPADLDQMVLPPCHYGFQVYTRELSLEERISIWDSKYLNDVKLEDSMDNLTLNEYNIPTRAISLMWNQRSVDTFLGLPFNIASYGLLLEIIAKEVNMVPDELIGNLGDVHLYLNHIEQAKEQIGQPIFEESPTLYSNGPMNDGIKKQIIVGRTREPYPLPILHINDLRSDTNTIINDITKWSVDDFKIENYQSHPVIKAPLSN